ncbi:MAG TPA: PepSY domain-containing protein [Actinomycetota bacterium]|nr:PepSY domain-containing protein [Actinomycetota bacterium]
MRRPRSVLAATGLAVAVLLAGCGGSDTTTSGQQATSTTSTTTSQSTTTSSAATTSSTAASASTDASVAAALRALQTATRAVPNGKAFDLDDDTRRGQRVWEVKVASGQRQFDLDVAADGTRVLNRREDPTPDDDVRKLRSVKVDATRALRLAAQRQDGQVTDLDLDTTDAGTVVWEVDFRQPNGTTTTVAIHARTGKVVDISGD